MGLLEGKINHQEKNIELVYNQPLASFSASESFTATVNGQAVAVAEAKLKAGEERVVSLLLESPVQYGDQVRLSYAGTDILTATGTALAPFADQEIQVLANGQIMDVPGRIQAEDFTTNQGFETEGTTDAGGGLNIGYTDPGDYLEYAVYVGQEGVYSVGYRVAALSGTGKFKLQLFKNGNWQDVDVQSFPATGGWQSWSTINGEASLPQGLQQLRLLAESGGFNLNWFELNYLRPTGLQHDGIDSTIVSLYPNPSAGAFKIAFKAGAPRPQELMITDMAGKKILLLKPGKGVSELMVHYPLAKGLYLLAFEVSGKRITKKLVVE